MIHPNQRISIRSIERAATLIDPVFRDSPQFECEPLNQLLGTSMLLKVETLNPLRSFKGRGADFFLHENAVPLAGRGLACATAGNWGQAMAYVCRARGWPLVVYCATNANPMKVERMRAMGAEVRLHGDDVDAAKNLSRAIALTTLFLGGLALGRYAGYGSWRTGLGMAGLGAALVVAINALGG